ncbi:alpha/beta fold hydrolase [Streptomyces sp. SID13666]|uniref:alpha/beta hydrolase n=1 Tax=unclassified Streptomyces TaxID=2593676 RepID=UPI0013C02F65|nr:MULTISPECIES: alpha/beta fold hydrolase [unclassified Streptomyces]NEA59552.1 alpha/beta fold hydrolase [Streptomyces sp. SID13666]NEA72722.1 alpha/beta fold hydrolase [Streptomyces sp. SID13588]
MGDRETAFRSLDGTALSGTVSDAVSPQRGAAVLVHGAGVTREEGGFFARLATGLASAGVGCLRFDLRAHGASGGRAEELTIAGVTNDIRAAGDHLRAEAGHAGPVHVIAASFSGGAAALHAAHQPAEVGRVVLLNPRLDYRERYITRKPYWAGDCLSPEFARSLDEQGFTEKDPFELGRALLNEVFYLDAAAIVSAVRAPVLIVHGTADTFVSVESSRHYRPLFGGPTELMELDGAQHGFAVHEDPQYLDPQSQAWQAEVIERVTGFLTN